MPAGPYPRRQPAATSYIRTRRVTPWPPPDGRRYRAPMPPLPRSVSRPLKRDRGRRRGAVALGGRVRLYRGWGVIAVLMGMAALVWGVGVAGGVPGKVGDEKAWAAAADCPPGISAAAQRDCLRTVRATVTRTVIRTSARSSTFSLTLAGPEPANGVVRMGAAGPLLRALRNGDQVDATVWRHYVVKVARDGRGQETEDNPEGDAETATAWALSLLVAALFFGGTGGYALVAARRVVTERLTRHVAPLLGFTVLAGLTTWLGCVAGVAWGGPWMVVGAWLATLPLCALLVRRYVRRQAARSARTGARTV